MKKTLTYIGEDSWSRQVYKDENGKLWKDTDNREGWLRELFSACNNEFEGEPDNPMTSGIECEFVPYRIIRN